MKKTLVVFGLLFITFTAGAQKENQNMKRMNRIDLCKENYANLFGGEALSGQGSDPEFMDILQKFIFGEVFAVGDLDIRTRELITCTTLAVMQTLPQLKAHAEAALRVGVTPIELREAIYQCAPFIGFPKTLNAVGIVNEVFEKHGVALPLEPQGTVTEETRAERGVSIHQSLYGDEVSSGTAYVPGDMGNEVARFMTEYAFGDIYTRNGLDLKTRELLIYCIFTTIGDEDQLRSHIKSNSKLGNNREILTAAVIQCLPYIGFPFAMKALDIIRTADLSPAQNDLVRLSFVTIDPNRLEEYNVLLKEEIETSMQLEPGVRILYAVADRKVPNRITILEIYDDEKAYERHLKTAHFRKYKRQTLDMVQALELIDTVPLIPGLKIK